MDEITVWNDMISNTIVEKTWAKEVPLKSTRKEKVRVLVCSQVKLMVQNVNLSLCLLVRKENQFKRRV